MREKEIKKTNIILTEMVYDTLTKLEDKTTNDIYLKHIISRKWVICNILYNFEDARVILEKYWHFSILGDLYNHLLGMEKIMDNYINKIIVSELDCRMSDDWNLSETFGCLFLISKVLENFDESMMALKRGGFFQTHNCIKQELTLKIS